MSTKHYKAYTEGDKAAIKDLKAEAEAKLGKPIALADMIAAVEPELETPEHLRGL